MKELTFSQKAAARMAREKLNGAIVHSRQCEAEFLELLGQIGLELGIAKEDLNKWQLNEDTMKFELKKEPPALKIPKKK
jgi:hypothetical protein